MIKIVLSFLIIPFILTNAYANEIYCPTTHIAVDGKCQPTNYIDPLYYIVIIIGIIGIISLIFFIKKKQNTN